MNDALDLRGQLFEGVTLFVEIVVPVVSAPHTGQHGVAETHLGDLGPDSGLGQQSPGRPSKVVQPPARDAAGRVEGFLALVEATERARPVGAENMIVTRKRRHGRDDLLRRRAERNHHVAFALVSLFGDDPDLAIRRQFTALQASPLAAPRCRQQQELHEAAERTLVLLSRDPDALQFVVCEGFVARTFRTDGARQPPGTSGDT